VCLEVVARQRRYGVPAGRGRERQHLEARAVEGDEILREQGIACLEEGVWIELEGGADSIVRVEADAGPVAGEDEEEVE